MTAKQIFEIRTVSCLLAQVVNVARLRVTLKVKILNIKGQTMT
ncbi:MAG TPA: hypothetical protein VIS72_18515 [Anaerolineales bacterium]